MDALGIFELTAKAGRAYVCAIRQAYRDAKAGDPQSDYYASRLGVVEEGGEALEPVTKRRLCECGHEQGDHECGLCQVVLNERDYGATPIFCPCPRNDETTCYFCGDPTTNIVTTDRAGDNEFVCEQCADDELGNYPPMPRNYEKCGDCGNDMILRHVCDPPAADAPPQVPPSSAGRGVGSPGVSAGAEESAPPGGWPTAEAVTTADVIAKVLGEHFRTRTDGDTHYHCYTGTLNGWHGKFESHDEWCAHVAPFIAAAVGVGATPTPKPAEPTTFPCVVTGCMDRFNNFAELNTHSYWTHLEPDPFKTNEDPLVRYERYPGASPTGDFKWFSIKVTYPKSKAQK